MGLMAKIKAAGAALAALGGISKALSVASWLLGVGPVAGIASAVLGFFFMVARKLFEGLTAMVANPATFFVAGVVGLSAFTFGVIHGGHRGAERVAELVKERNDAHAEAEKRLEAALAAKKAAEEAAKADASDRNAVVQATPDNSISRPVRRRVRKPAKTSGDGLCLQGFPAVFGGCETSGIK